MESNDEMINHEKIEEPQELREEGGAEVAEDSGDDVIITPGQ